MRKHYYLAIIFLVPAYGLGDYPSDNETENDNTFKFATENSSVKVLHRDIETEGKCPSIALLTKDKKNALSSVDLCLIRIPGYREFHALKDFAYIDFSNYRLQDQSTVLYDVDLAIQKGSSFVATCQVNILKNALTSGGCEKLE